jgi:hypothetical protein
MNKFMVGIVVAGWLMGMIVGCSHNEAGGVVAPQKQGQAAETNVQRIQNNPNISAQAKAHITAQMQSGVAGMPRQ